MTVRELLARIDSHELSEWMAYYRIEPFGQRRDDWHAAMISATIANVHRKSTRRPFTAEDFLAFPEPDEEKDMNEQIKEVFRHFRKS